MISVIVPVYNTAQYLPRCIDSILAQTHTNLEIILVNDGSTDESGKMCDEYALRNSRVKVIHKTNGGLSSARNAGLAVAGGLWIGFVDGDDYITPNMYEQLLAVAQDNRADMAICGYRYVDENGETLHKTTFENSKTFTNAEALYNLVTAKESLYTIIPNKLFKKSVFDTLRFPEGKVHEDEHLAHHLISKCNNLAVCGNVMYMYVQRIDSIMNKTYTIKRLQDAWDAVYDRYIFFKEKGNRKCARYTKRTLGYIVRTGMKNLDWGKHKDEVLPLYRKALWLLICSLDLRAVKLFIAWHRWR